MKADEEKAQPKMIRRTQKERKAYEAFKHRMTIPFAKLGYRVDFKIEANDKVDIVLARLVDSRIGLWAVAETPLQMLTNKKLFEVSIVGATQTLWERMGEGLRGMRKDQKCWLRLKALRDRKRKELEDGKETELEDGTSEDRRAKQAPISRAEAIKRAEAAGLHIV